MHYVYGYYIYVHSNILNAHSGMEKFDLTLIPP